MNFSKIKMMFFDFDDTLLIHYREQRLDVAVIVYRLLLLHSKRQKMVKIGQTILR